MKAGGREERRKRKEREEETELPLTQLRRGGSPTQHCAGKKVGMLFMALLFPGTQKKVAEAGVPGQPVPQHGEVRGTEPGDHLSFV